MWRALKTAELDERGLVGTDEVGQRRAIYNNLLQSVPQVVVLKIIEDNENLVDEEKYNPVSYTHLTLPTNREV